MDLEASRAVWEARELIEAASDDLARAGDIDRALELLDDAARIVEAGSLLEQQVKQAQAVAFVRRYEARGDPTDLNRGGEILKGVLAQSVLGDKDRRLVSATVAVILYRRWQVTHDAEILDEAIEVGRQSLEGELTGTLPWRTRAQNLALALSDRGGYGSAEDVDEAIRLAVTAVNTTPAGDPGRTTSLINLARSHANAFDSLGRIEDLSAALALYEQILESERITPHDRVLALTGRGNCLRRRHEVVSRDPDDLEQAIASIGEALQVAPPDWSEAVRWKSLLAAVVRQRGEETSSAEQVRWAVRLYEEALSGMAMDSPEVARLRANRASALAALGAETDESSFLLEAIAELQSLVQDPAFTSEERAGLLTNLGHFLLADPRASVSGQNRLRAAAAYEKALKGLAHGSLPRVTLEAARARASLALEDGDHKSATEWFTRACEAADQLSGAQWLDADRDAWLQNSAKLHGELAYCLAHSTRTDDAALVLETSRARTLTRLLERDQRELTRLRAEHPSAARALESALARVRVAEEEERRLSELRPDEKEQLRLRMRTARRVLEQDLAEVRSLPGWRNFFSREHDHAGVTGHESDVLYITPTRVGGFGILLRPHQRAEHFRLPDLREDTIARQADMLLTAAEAPWLGLLDDALDETTGVLGDLLIDPLRDVLTSTSQLVIVASGLLGLLPLHAAWTESPTSADGRCYAIDLATFSYAPNARAVAVAAHTHAEHPLTRGIAVGDPRPTRARALPGARAEASEAAKQFVSAVSLLGSDATRSQIVAELQSATAVHFACHATADVKRPLASYLLLAADDRLTLSDLLSIDLSRIDLAVLSACETGVIGGPLPDEALSLGSGMLAAGVHHVVATLWSVEDEITRALISKFYARLQAGLSPAEALNESQRWLRQSCHARPSQWAAFYHLGPPRDARFDVR
jgi:CHAT domain-containing protein